MFIRFCRFYRVKGFLDASGAEQSLSWDAPMGSGEGNTGQQIRVELLTVCQKTSAFFQPPCPLLVICMNTVKYVDFFTDGKEGNSN